MIKPAKLATSILTMIVAIFIFQTPVLAEDMDDSVQPFYPIGTKVIMDTFLTMCDTSENIAKNPDFCSSWWQFVSQDNLETDSPFISAVTNTFLAMCNGAEALEKNHDFCSSTLQSIFQKGQEETSDDIIIYSPCTVALCAALSGHGIYQFHNKTAKLLKDMQSTPQTDPKDKWYSRKNLGRSSIETAVICVALNNPAYMLTVGSMVLSEKAAEAITYYQTQYRAPAVVQQGWKHAKRLWGAITGRAEV
ncbi:MAG: hypothetical protein K2Q34_05840 [Alphaproteobacteria bacterium]|nr:hypothetical protein [Alphaproteobacteria bacterium]